jgi:protein gp37
MSEHSSIEWTDATWPVTTGCDDASPGCLNCYSKRDSHRLAGNPNAKVSAAYSGTTERRDGGPIRWTGKLNLMRDRLDWPFKWKKPRRIFVGNMSDLFHPAVPDEFIDDVFRVMSKAQHHTFQVLTKRAERMAEFCLKRWDERHENPVWHPLKNVWCGVSVENQKYADERIPHLLKTPAAVRFLSCEPLLGPIDLKLTEWQQDGPDQSPYNQLTTAGQGLSWVIVGGESGHGARPMKPEWARKIRDDCHAAGVAYFHKQNGEWVECEKRGDTYAITHVNGRLRPTKIVYQDGRSFDYASNWGGKDEGVAMERIGKKAAGRLLDGRAWDDMPTPAGAHQS